MTTATSNGHKPVTAASSWKASTAPAAEPVTLPSGNVAVLRERVSVYDLVRTGRADDEIIEALDKMQAGTLDDTKVAIRLQDLICEVMFIEPKVGDGDGQLSLSLVDDDDIDFVVVRAFGGAPDLSFRRDENSDGPRADSEDVRADAVKPARDSRRKPGGAGDGPAPSKGARAKRKGA